MTSRPISITALAALIGITTAATPISADSGAHQEWLFNHAVDLHAKNSPLAAEKLRKFLDQYPDDPRAPRALYRLTLIERDSAPGSTRPASVIEGLVAMPDAGDRNAAVKDVLAVAEQAGDSMMLDAIRENPSLSTLPAWRERLFATARKAERDGDTVSALSLLENLSVEGTSLDPLLVAYTRAALYWRMGDTVAAYRATRSEAALDNPLARPYLELQTWSAYSTGDFPAALSAARQRRALDPDTPLPEIDRIRLVSLLETGDAESAGREALALYRTFHYSFALDGFLEAARAVPGPAVFAADAKELLSASPEDAALSHTIPDYAFLLEEKGASADALELYDLALTSNPPLLSPDELARELEARRAHASVVALAARHRLKDPLVRLWSLASYDETGKLPEGFREARALLDDPACDSPSAALRWIVRWMKKDDALCGADAFGEIAAAVKKRSIEVSGPSAWFLVTRALSGEQAGAAENLLSSFRGPAAEFADSAILDRIAEMTERRDTAGAKTWSAVFGSPERSKLVRADWLACRMYLAYRDGDFASVRSIAETEKALLEEHPDSWRLTSMVAESARAAGDEEAAMIINGDIAERSTDFPTATRAKLRMAEMLLATGQPSENARKLLAEAMKGDLDAIGETPRALYFAGVEALTRGDDKAAVAHWKRVAELQPETAWTARAKEMIEAAK